MSNAHFVASPKRKCRSSSAGFIGYRERRLLSILNKKKLERVLAYMLDETEFLGPHGIRSLSRYHLEHPFVFHVGGEEYKVQYVPGESNTGMFGGNSNWPRMDAGQWTDRPGAGEPVRLLWRRIQVSMPDRFRALHDAVRSGAGACPPADRHFSARCQRATANLRWDG